MVGDEITVDKYAIIAWHIADLYAMPICAEYAVWDTSPAWAIVEPSGTVYRPDSVKFDNEENARKHLIQEATHKQ